MIRLYKQNKGKILKINLNIVPVDINNTLIDNNSLENLSLGKIKSAMP